MSSHPSPASTVGDNLHFRATWQMDINTELFKIQRDPSSMAKEGQSNARFTPPTCVRWRFLYPDEKYLRIITRKLTDNMDVHG